MLFSAPEAWIRFARPSGSALEARAYFFLLRQEKVAKKKATPGYAVGVADFPALLATGGGCGTRAYGPQTVLALFPPAAPLLGAPHGDPESKTSRSHHHFRAPSASARLVFPGPLRGAEQRRSAGGSRRALFEGRSPELRSRPAFRVAQGTRQRRAPTQGWHFLWLLSFGHTKESTPASKAEPQANRSRKRGTHRKSNPVHQNHSPEKH